MVRKLMPGDSLRDLGAEIVVRRHARHHRCAGGHARLLSVYFTMVDLVQLPGSGHQRCSPLAKSLGVRAFVNLSQMTVSQMSETETTSSPQTEAGWLAEQMLRWSGLPVSTCVDRFLRRHVLGAGVKGIREITSSACRSPTARPRFSPVPNVGPPPAAVLAEPARISASSNDLTGLQSLTMAQYAGSLVAFWGRTIQYVNRAPQTWEAKLPEARLPEHLIAHLSTWAS